MIRVVICDDEEASRKIIRYYAENSGLPIEIAGTASDGEAALRLIEKEEPDLAFMDIRMPGCNGFEVIERLKGSRTRCIIVTAYSSFDYAQRALRLGAADILAKPIDMEQLHRAILRAMDFSLTPNDTLNRAMLYIQQHYAENLSVRELAQQACCTESHLTHIFQKHLRLSTTAYLNKFRVEKAAVLLGEGVSVQEAAFRVGYNNLNYFYKNFKLYMGITPAVYQKNH